MPLILAIAIIAVLVAILWKTRQISLPTLCLLTVFVAVVFGSPYWSLDAGPLPLTLDRLLLAGLLLIFPVLAWNRRADIKLIHTTDVLVLMLAGLLVISTVLHDWRYKDSLPLSRLIFFNLMPVAYYFLARHSRLDSQKLGGFLVLLAGFATYASITAILEQREWYAFVFPAFITDPRYAEFLGRARGPFLNPVSLGICIATGLLACAALWKERGPRGKCLIATAMLLMVLASFLTYTRSVWLGCVASLAILAWFPSSTQVRGALIASGAVVLACLGALFWDNLHRFQRDKNVSEAEMAQSAELRPLLAHVAWRMFLDKPLFGHGFGQYTRAKRPYHFNDRSGLPLSKVLPYMQHNVFLSYLTETGLAGMAILVILFGMAVRVALRLWQDPYRTRRERFAGLMLLALVANLVINGMFHDVSIMENLNAFWFLLLGIGENLIWSPNTRADCAMTGSPQPYPHQVAA